MANRFMQFREQGQQQPEAQPRQNRFAKFRQTAQPQAQPVPQMTSGEGKGDMADMQMSNTEYATDLVRSAGTGLRSGVEMLAGAPADLARLAASGITYGIDRLGGKSAEEASMRSNERKQKIAALESSGQIETPRTTENIQKATTSIIGEHYQPKTTGGKYARAIGEFAPSAVTGPGGLVRKGAMAVIPAVMSEGAGQLTEGTAAEPYARGAAAITGAIATGGRSNVGKVAAKNAPPRSVIQGQTDALYGKLRNAGIKYDGNEFSRMTNGLERRLSHMGIHPKLSPNTSAILDDMKAMAAKGQSPDFNDYERFRMLAGDVASSGNPLDKMTLRDAKFAGEIKKALDTFADSASYIHNGSAPNAKALMVEARALAARNIKARTFERAVELARDQASGFENGLRIQFRRLKKDPQFYKGLSQVEKKMVDDVVRGTTAQNLLAQFGRTGIAIDKLGSKATLIPAMVTGAGYGGGNLAAGAGIVAAGTAAKYLAGKNAEKIAERMISTTIAGPRAQANALAQIKNKKSGRNASTAVSANQSGSSRDAPRWPPGAVVMDPKGIFYDAQGNPIASGR